MHIIEHHDFCSFYERHYEAVLLIRKSTSEPSRADDPIVLNFASTQYSLNKFVKYFLIICLNHLSRTKSRARPLGHRTLPWTITSLRKWIVRLQWWQSLKSAKHIAKSLWKSIYNHPSIQPSSYLWDPSIPARSIFGSLPQSDQNIHLIITVTTLIMMITTLITDIRVTWMLCW